MKTKKIGQDVKLLKYLLSANHPVTNREIIQNIYTNHPTALIRNLIKKGFTIDSQWVSGQNSIKHKEYLLRNKALVRSFLRKEHGIY